MSDSEPDSDTLEGSASLPMYYPPPSTGLEDYYTKEGFERLRAAAVANLQAQGDFELAAVVAAGYTGPGKRPMDDDDDDDEDDESEDSAAEASRRYRMGLKYFGEDTREEEHESNKDMKPFDLGKLPPELYDNILEYLEFVTDVDILRSLCAVNKTFNVRFTPLLYSHIELIHPTGGYKQKNALHTDLVSTLASRDNEHYKHVQVLSIVDQLANSAYSDVQPPVLSLVCSFLKKSQLKEIYLNIDGTTLEPNGVGDFKNSAAEDILLDHLEVEKVDWSLFVNRLEGRVRRDRWRHLTSVVNTKRPALKSVNICNIHEYDSLLGLKALLKSATELRELGLGIMGWPQDSIYIDDTSSPNFEGDIDQQAYYRLLMNEDGNDPPPLPMDTNIAEVDGADSGFDMISLTHHIFFFIDTRCAIRESLTSLRLEKTRLDLHKDTPLLISKCLDIKGLQKLVLLDCKGLPRLLDLLETSEMKSLKTIHLEYRKRYSEDVNRFLDRLPTPPTDLALMQSGGGIKLPGSDGSWPSFFAPYLRSLVLDARKEIPFEEWDAQADFVEVFEPGCTGISLDTDNERLFLQLLFGKMTKLEELGLSVDLDELTKATPDSKFLRLPKNRPTERNKGKGKAKPTPAAEASSSSSTSASSFLSWLTSNPLPNLHTFQLRNSRKLRDIKAMKEIFGINYDPSQSSDFRLQADVEHLHSILPQVSNFIIGVKRPNQHFHATPPSSALPQHHPRHHHDSEDEDGDDPMLQLLRVNDTVERKQSEMWQEMMYLMLYIVCRGKRSVDRRPLHHGIPVETVGRVLPHHHWNAWHGRKVRVGCTEVMEESTLPKCWRDVGSSVYEAGWSR